MNMQADPTWPDSTAFWQDKRVIVTGGSGFLGSFIVDKLRARGAAEVIVPRRADYDLRDIQAIRQLFADVQKSAIRNPQSAIRNPNCT
jgi:GDP-L-fucose synthase